jgi:hypothetical protein
MTQYSIRFHAVLYSSVEFSVKTERAGHGKKRSENVATPPLQPAFFALPPPNFHISLPTSNFYPYLRAAIGSYRDEKGTWVEVPDSPAAVISKNPSHIIATGCHVQRAIDLAQLSGKALWGGGMSPKTCQTAFQVKSPLAG